MVKPRQPAFSARKNADQNNVATGSAVTVLFQTEIFDQQGNFAGNAFTAPVTGKYQLSVNLRLSNIDTAADQYDLRITTSNRGYLELFDPDGFDTDPASVSVSFSVLADMDAGDTAIVTFEQNAGTAQTDILNSLGTRFMGFLAC